MNIEYSGMCNAAFTLLVDINVSVAQAAIFYILFTQKNYWPFVRHLRVSSDINFLGLMDHCLLGGMISTICIISVLKRARQLYIYIDICFSDKFYT